MILDSITLNNFGLYRGEQVLNLLPEKRNGKHRPIVLIGGANGGGKTTLFDAVQLALYGSRGKYSKRTNVSYDKFLNESIHYGISASEDASVGLKFQIQSSGEQHVYEVRRVWNMSGEALHESLYVYKDGERDQSLAEHWTDLVEEIIPLGVSQLFFFDAEKIRFIADDQKGNEALGIAIKSLLGLNLAEQLIADSSLLEKRLSKEAAETIKDQEYDKLLKLFQSAQLDVKRKKEERASLENDRLRAENELKKIRNKFEKAGGHHWEKRTSREQQLVQYQTRENELKAQLIRMASGPLPISLVPNLFESLEQHNTLEKEALKSKLVHDILIKRDSDIIRQVKEIGLDKHFVNAIKKIHQADRERRIQKSVSTIHLELSDSASNSLSHLILSGIPSLHTELKTHLKSLDETRNDRESLQRVLNQSPDDSDIAKIVESLSETSTKYALLEDRAIRLDNEIHSLVAKSDEIQRSIQKKQRAVVDRQIKIEESARMAKLAIRTQETMKEYLRVVTTKKIDRLSGFVTDSFKYLLRKKTLVERVQINPDSFEITLTDNRGQTISKQRLSEGEKQIFAISVLWGLAQASPRPLPAMIDTPMARLDSEHRKHLVERYFPNASHQVIIFSTDTEVDEEFYETLKPNLARAYYLNYEEVDRMTTVTEGYFWRTDNSFAQEIHV